MGRNHRRHRRHHAVSLGTTQLFSIVPADVVGLIIEYLCALTFRGIGVGDNLREYDTQRFLTQLRSMVIIEKIARAERWWTKRALHEVIWRTDLEGTMRLLRERDTYRTGLHDNGVVVEPMALDVALASLRGLRRLSAKEWKHVDGWTFRAYSVSLNCDTILPLIKPNMPIVKLELIGQFALFDDTAELISRMPYLADLDVRACGAITNTGYSKILCNAVCLERFAVRHSHSITHAPIIAGLKTSKTLKHLTIRNCPGVDGDFVNHIGKLNSLDFCGTTDEDRFHNFGRFYHGDRGRQIGNCIPLDVPYNTTLTLVSLTHLECFLTEALIRWIDSLRVIETLTLACLGYPIELIEQLVTAVVSKPSCRLLKVHGLVAFLNAEVWRQAMCRIRTECELHVEGTAFVARYFYTGGKLMRIDRRL